MLRIESKYPEKLLRPVQWLGRFIADKSARMGQPLRFGQVSCDPPQGLLGALAFRHIDHGTQQFNDVSRVIQDRVPDHLNMFHRSVVQRDPELACDIYFFAERLLKVPIYPVPILGVDESGNRFPVR